jgi:hypothetical protein
LFKTKYFEERTSSKIKEHAILTLQVLNHKVINKEKLQKLAFTGISDEIKCLRPIIWRVLLGHFPLETDLWDSALKKSKANYDEWKNELII